MDHLVLTVIAADKPGVVERIAQCIASFGGNWLESRMAHMAGQFAGILRVSVPVENRQALIAALEDLSTHGIRVLLGESNLERLITDVRPAPMSSDLLFHAEALLAVPLTLPLETLQAALETLADDLMVELELRSEE